MTQRGTVAPLRDGDYKMQYDSTRIQMSDEKHLAGTEALQSHTLKYMYLTNSP